MIRDCEYDNYPIPEYDPSLSSDERQRLMDEAQADLEATIKWALEQTK